MKILRSTSIGALLIAVVLALGACGGGGHGSSPPAALERCNPNDQTMQCALQNQSPPVTARQAPFAQHVFQHGVDFAYGAPSASFMRSHGWSFGASYLSTDSGKNWQLGQFRSLQRGGVAGVAVWETSAERALGGCGAGRSDAQRAWAEAKPFGFRVIYFAVDFELQGSQTSTVKSYFRCAASVGGASKTGVYGGIFTMEVVLDSGTVRYGWQTYAWSSGRWDPRAQLQQWLNGNQFDYDRAVAADFGQTPFHVVPVKRKPVVKPKPHRPSKRQRALERRIRQIRGELAHRGCHRHPRRHGCRKLAREGRIEHRRLDRLVGRRVVVR